MRQLQVRHCTEVERTRQFVPVGDAPSISTITHTIVYRGQIKRPAIAGGASPRLPLSANLRMDAEKGGRQVGCSRGVRKTKEDRNHQ
jgi:hypothetical protein